MAQDPATSGLVLIVAIFVLPKILTYIPDFDPLMVIVGLFALIAFLQHAGFVGAAGEPSGVAGVSSSASHRGERDRGGDKDKAREPSPKDLLDAAERCLEQNNYARVRELAGKATDLDPENARAWELLATAQKWEGRRDEALATVRKARDVFEVKSSGLKALAEELERSHDPEATAKECERKGEDFIGRRQYDLACECYTKAIEALGETSDGSTAVRLRRRRAECAQQLQDWSMCRRDATAVLEQDPSDAQALLQRAASNEALEKFAAALEDARKLLSLDPKSAVANRIVHNCQQALRG